MDNIGQKPQFLRAGKDDSFKRLAKEVHETVLKNKRLQHKNIIKALGFLIAFLISYTGILTFGNNILLLYPLYIIMGFSMILIFVNPFHEASHGALFTSKRQNRIFCYVVDFFWNEQRNLDSTPFTAASSLSQYPKLGLRY